MESVGSQPLKPQKKVESSLEGSRCTSPSGPLQVGARGQKIQKHVIFVVYRVWTEVKYSFFNLFGVKYRVWLRSLIRNCFRGSFQNKKNWRCVTWFSKIKWSENATKTKMTSTKMAAVSPLQRLNILTHPLLSWFSNVMLSHDIKSHPPCSPVTHDAPPPF